MSSTETTREDLPSEESADEVRTPTIYFNLEAGDTKIDRPKCEAFSPSSVYNRLVVLAAAGRLGDSHDVEAILAEAPKRQAEST